MRKRLRRVLLSAGAAILVLVLTVIGAVRGSLPQLTGTVAIGGLIAPVTVSRDSLGVPDIVGSNRPDVARALGFLHGQERFFQMDLQRRNAAGELAALFGAALLEIDRDTRRHRFRERAERVVAATAGQDRAILEAYTAGVNAGLQSLRVRPFEYLVLRQKPVPWRLADSVLTMYAMFLDLSLDTARSEEVWALVRDNLSPALTALLLPRGNLWEAPLEAGLVTGVVIPDSLDLDGGYETATAVAAPPHHDTAGSNNFAVAGRLTGHGGAIMANDMHLGLGLPNIWYRARMSWPEGAGVRSLVGVTLPGTPALVAGSNGQAAWGFTNSYGDFVDLVILEADPADSTRYRTPSGWRDFDRRAEVIAVAGGEPDTLWIDETIWGPVWTRDSRGRRLALRWTAHDTEAVNFGLMRLETAPDVQAVVALAGTLGMPPQNLICADSAGHIAWTIAGPIPRRVGWDGRLPVSWADGSCRWDGYWEPSRQPRVIDPAEGRVWTANSRVVAGENLQIIGDGGYALGPRARQIRDDLRALKQPLEKDLLGVELDDRALFLGVWRDLVLGVLARQEPAPGSPRAQFAEVVRQQWSGRADGPSVAYRLVRDFSYACIGGIYDKLISGKIREKEVFSVAWMPYRHAVAWKIITTRKNKDALVLAAVDRVMAKTDPQELATHTWGARNATRIVHPFVLLVPRLSRWLAAPEQELPGDSFMPRVQHRSSGASERMVVSPGREELALFHMPGGQSGHPLSPFFLAGHDAWAEGRPTPLLPGRAVYRLILEPKRRTDN